MKPIRYLSETTGFRIRAISLIAFILLALAACTVMPPPTQAGGPANAVTIKNFAFTPPIITVQAGTLVIWSNNDGVQHTVTGTGAEVFDSGHVMPNGGFGHTFNAAGNFPYQCNIHASMHGNVIVTP